MNEPRGTQIMMSSHTSLFWGVSLRAQSTTIQRKKPTPKTPKSRNRPAASGPNLLRRLVRRLAIVGKKFMAVRSKESPLKGCKMANPFSRISGEAL
jgi:hypothetical protein